MDLYSDFLLHENDFLKLENFIDAEVFLKLEGLNPAGSVKLKTAYSLIKSYEDSGKIDANTVLIESSSGNLGCALASVCARKGYKFMCIVDPNTTSYTIKMMKAMGAIVHCVTERDSNGGYLGSRISFIKALLIKNPHFIWLNQYANDANPAVHESITAKSIDTNIKNLDYLFIGAGTTGTLMGCLRYFRKNNPKVKIIAVDTVGSVTFGKPPSKRYIPGLGTSRCPEIFSMDEVGTHLLIPEVDAIEMCRHIAKNYGLVLGGSTGTVLSAVLKFKEVIRGSKIVAISPDMGDKYLDTVYDDEWTRSTFKLKQDRTTTTDNKNKTPLELTV